MRFLVAYYYRLSVILWNLNWFYGQNHELKWRVNPKTVDSYLRGALLWNNKHGEGIYLLGLAGRFYFVGFCNRFDAL